MWVQLNDRLVDEREALVSVFDRGFMYGDGVFETFRAYQGTGFRIGAHLDRLAGAAASLGFDLPRTASEIRRDVRSVLAKNQLEDGVIRISVSRGRGGRGPGVEGVSGPTWVVAAWPLPEDLGERRRRGWRLATVPTRRLHPSTLPAGAKLANYLNSVMARSEAAGSGADEGLMLTVDGMLAECATANFVFVCGDAVCTPSLDQGVLPGITRALVLALARETGIRTGEEAYPPGILEDASEAFVTNSLAGVQPVAAIDGRAYPVPGPLTATLMEAYAACVLRETGGCH